MRLKVLSSVDFPQPEGPMNAVTFFSGDVEGDLLQGVELAVVEVQVAHAQLGVFELQNGGHGTGFSVSASCENIRGRRC